MDIKLGEEIFKKCNGNSFVIQREYGKEYKKCRVPQEYEQIWIMELRQQLQADINASNKRDRYSAFLKLCDIISHDEAAELAINLLNCDLDLFERLLYVEYLKQLNDRKFNRFIYKIIEDNKIILSSNINIVKENAKDYFVINFDYIEDRVARL